MSSALKYQNELKRQGVYEEIVPANPADPISTLMELQYANKAADKALSKILGKRRNPLGDAEEMFEAFHGRPSDEVIEVISKRHEHLNLWVVGELVEIVMKDGEFKRLSGFGGAFLASNEKGTQLFIEGGDQEIDLDGTGLDATKEKVNLGRVRDVVYKTDKMHLGRADKKPGPYTHRLGEEGGEMPDLVYEPLNKALEFVGGHYKIERDMEGGFSAGIRN